MDVLGDLVSALAGGSVEVVDLTAPLSARTPILALPEQSGQTSPFSLAEISRYDERGPGWYWNNISTGEHTGTHLDAPVHWVTGRDGTDVSRIAPARLAAPAPVVDRTAEAAADPDFLLEVDHVRAWEAEHGPLPEGGWLLYRTAWGAPTACPGEIRHAADAGAHPPAISPACARWRAGQAPVTGLEGEPVGTNAGPVRPFDPPFP